MKLGLKEPKDIGMFLNNAYSDDSGMEYELYESTDGLTFYVGAAHEEVGLVTWYSFTTQYDAEVFAGII